MLFVSFELAWACQLQQWASAQWKSISEWVSELVYTDRCWCQCIFRFKSNFVWLFMHIKQSLREYHHTVYYFFLLHRHFMFTFHSALLYVCVCKRVFFYCLTLYGNFKIYGGTRSLLYYRAKENILNKKIMENERNENVIYLVQKLHQMNCITATIWNNNTQQPGNKRKPVEHESNRDGENS